MSKTDHLQHMLETDAIWSQKTSDTLKRLGLHETCNDLCALFEALTYQASHVTTETGTYSPREYAAFTVASAIARHRAEKGPTADGPAQERILGAIRRATPEDPDCAESLLGSLLNGLGLASVADVPQKSVGDVCKSIRRLAGLILPDKDGGRIAAIDAHLRITMLLIVAEEYLIALGHFLRGHRSKMWDHTRRALESAAIAYASRQEPHLGFMWGQGEEGSYRDATKPDLVFRSEEPPMPMLRSAYKQACAYVHPNPEATFLRVLSEERATCDGKVAYTDRVLLNEFDPDNFDSNALIALLTTLVYFEQMAVILARAIDVPAGEVWYVRQAMFHRQLEDARARLAATGLIRSPEDSAM